MFDIYFLSSGSPCRFTCENVMKVLRSNKDSVMAMLEAFVYDPLINWRLLNTNDATSDIVNVRDAEPKEGMRSLEQMLKRLFLALLHTTDALICMQIAFALIFYPWILRSWQVTTSLRGRNVMYLLPSSSCPSHHACLDKFAERLSKAYHMLCFAVYPA